MDIKQLVKKGSTQTAREKNKDLFQSLKNIDDRKEMDLDFLRNQHEKEKRTKKSKLMKKTYNFSQICQKDLLEI